MKQLTTSRHPRGTDVDPRWAALNLVQTAREALGLRDRDIAVLRGLLTFIPPDRWDGALMVFASNVQLRERCDGIDERTLRRRLARLCEVGLISRRQSPNRKRYVLRDAEGAPLLAYGFDLAPLREHLSQLQLLSDEKQRNDRHLRLLKTVLRDRLYHLEVSGLAVPSGTPDTAELRLLLRRKASAAQLSEAISQVESLLPTAQQVTGMTAASSNLTDSDGQIVRRSQSSEKEYYEKEALSVDQTHLPYDLTLGTCVDAVPAAMEFSPTLPRNWTELTDIARRLAPAIGINPDQWLSAASTLGERGASLAILGLVQAFQRIRNPVKYLQSLLNKANQGSLDIARMFRSLTAQPRFPAGNHTLQQI